MKVVSKLGISEAILRKKIAEHKIKKPRKIFVKNDEPSGILFERHIVRPSFLKKKSRSRITPC